FSLATKHASLVAIDDRVSTDGAPRRVVQPSAAAEREEALALEAPADLDGAYAARSRAPMPAAPPPAAPMLAAPFGGAPPPPMAFAAKAPARRAAPKGGGVIGRLKRALLGDDGEGAHEHAAPQAVDREPAPSIEAPGSDAYPEDELAWLRDRASGELDLVFLVDETGSMGPYIEQVKARLLELVAALRRMPLCRSLRLGLVTYRDHPPQDHTYASRTVPLTDEIAAIEAEVRKLTASGGGDGPESVTDGLFDVVRLAWRPAAAKAVVW